MKIENINRKKGKKYTTMERKCDICGGTEGEVMHSFSFTLHHGVELPPSYNLVACQRCGFTFADTPATQDLYDKFYAEQSKYEDKNISSGGSFCSWDRERFELVTKHLSEFVPKNATIVDVGCANGGLLLTLKNSGYKTLFGIDRSKVCVKNVCDAGIEAKQGGLFTEDIPAVLSKFDCILLSHVLEHVRDLSRAMAWILCKLSVEGLIYVEVPDASRYAEYYKIPYYYFDCEHINHFDIDSLKNLFQSAGFVLCDIRHKEIRVSGEDHYPVIAAIFQRRYKEKNSQLAISYRARRSIETYLRLSAEDDVYKKIEKLADKKSELMIWGAGQYALRLLSASRLRECRIVSFIDKDKNKQGKKLQAISIASPEVLRNFSGTIVVCSALHSADIEAEIRGMGLNNEVVILKSVRHCLFE